MEKIIEYGEPEKSKEEFVRHFFSKHARELGFEIINIQKKFPDCTALDLRYNKYNSNPVYIEFEYAAGNFAAHWHIKKMVEGNTYIIVCWLATGKEKVPRNVEIIVLSNIKEIEIRSPEEAILKVDSSKAFYRAIAFNSNFVEGKSIDIFNKVKIFVCNSTFKDDYLPKGSVFVLYEMKYFVGEFTVVTYNRIRRKPETDYEWSLLNLVSYPVTFIGDISQRNKFFKSYIGYEDFVIYNPPIPCNVINKKLSHGVTNLTYQDLQIIRGQRKN